MRIVYVSLGEAQLWGRW